MFSYSDGMAPHIIQEHLMMHMQQSQSVVNKSISIITVPIRVRFAMPEHLTQGRTET